MREVVWMGSSLDDLRAFSDGAKDEIGLALNQAQHGERPISATPMQGFHGASVLEIRVDDDGDTYRTVYTVQLRDAIYVLHAFKKKSKKGSATPQLEIERIRRRLRAAQEQSAQGITGH